MDGGEGIVDRRLRRFALYRGELLLVLEVPQLLDVLRGGLRGVTHLQKFYYANNMQEELRLQKRRKGSKMHKIARV